jgi:hypothetical protein
MSTPGAARGRYRDALHHRDLRLLLTASLIDQTGSWSYLIVISKCRLLDRARVSRATDEVRPTRHSCSHKEDNRPGRANPVTEQNPTTADLNETDDTEGHFRYRTANDTDAGDTDTNEIDDTEGHVRYRAANDTDAGDTDINEIDDTEGHFRYRTANDTDAGDTDANEIDDVEGHVRYR